MRRVTLECRRDDETGDLGLCFVAIAREGLNSATEGLLIAHDLIEHQNGADAIGGIDDELEALGAIWYVRGQHGQLRRDRVGSAHSIESSIASDVVRMFLDWRCGADCLVNTTARKRLPECDASEAIAEILACADRDYPGEFDATELADARERWPQYRRHACVLMRMGYNKARRRWQRHGQFAANNLFWAIADAVQPYCKSAEYEGAQYVLRYGNGKATCEGSYDNA